MQSPFVKFSEHVTRAGSGLLNKMNWAQSSHQNQTGDVNSAQENDRAHFAHRSEQQRLAKNKTNPAAGPLNVKCALPTLEVARLQLKQTCARRDEENAPWKPRDQSQLRLK